MQKLLLILIIILLSTALLSGQVDDLESRILRLLEKNQLNELIANIEFIKKRYPDNPTPYYIEALIEKDGEKAANKYYYFIEHFPTSKFVVNAKFKLAQFYFAKGSYYTARRYLRDNINTYPTSDFTDDSFYLKIRCLIALEQDQKAKEEIKIFEKQFSHSPFLKLLQNDLKSLTGEQQEKDLSIEANDYPPKYFTIQIGAFQYHENALKQKREVEQLGYQADIYKKKFGSNVFYLVWLGSFETEAEALNSGEIFKKKYGKSFRIVKKEDVR